MARAEPVEPSVRVVLGLRQGSFCTTHRRQRRASSAASPAWGGKVDAGRSGVANSSWRQRKCWRRKCSVSRLRWRNRAPSRSARSSFSTLRAFSLAKTCATAEMTVMARGTTSHP